MSEKKKTKRKLFGPINVANRFEVLRFLTSVLIAFLVTLAIIFLVTDEPFQAIKYLFLGPLESVRKFSLVIELMIPLTFTGLAVTVMFKANQFNMGAEGAFFMGGVAAAIIAIVAPLPVIIHPIVSIILASLAGGVVCAIPALLKIKWGASELVSSLMMNFICLNIGLYIINYYFRDPNAGSMASYTFRETAMLSNIVPKTRLHTGIFVMILATLIIIVFLNKTKKGYALKITGENANFAKYSGIKTAGVVLYSQFIGGMLAGAGGAVEMLGMYDRFKWQELTNYGFDGIIIAILAKENPKFVPLAAFFLAFIRIGADRMGSETNVSYEIVSILQGIFILLIAARGFLAKIKQYMVEKEARANG